MPIELSPDMESRLDDLARRIGCFGPNARQQVLKIALDDLDAKTPPPKPKLTPEQIAHEMEVLERLRESGRRWRKEHPGEYDESNPPSIAWQEELYDENGLPR